MWYAPKEVKCPTCPVCPELAPVDNSDILTAVSDIQTTLDEEDTWKDEAIALATEDWEKRDYREIYKALDDIFANIDDRDDIESVSIKDEEVTSFNVDEEDATVVQELKVKYEDLNGDTIKVYLTITTEIEEGEIENQEIEESL